MLLSLQADIAVHVIPLVLTATLSGCLQVFYLFSKIGH